MLKSFEECSMDTDRSLILMFLNTLYFRLSCILKIWKISMKEWYAPIEGKKTPKIKNIERTINAALTQAFHV